MRGALAAALATGLAGCGGGSGADRGPEPALPEPPRAEAPADEGAGRRPEPAPRAPDAEYDANWGFETLGVGALNARGGTGEGIVIGILDVDSSPEHRELAGKYTTIIPRPVPWHRTPHGGPVAAIMVAHRDGRGMRGVAYEARLAAFEAMHDPHAEEIDLEWLARAGPKLANSSIGGRLAAPTRARYLAAAQAFVEGGGVIVYATGNDAWARPEDTARAPAFDGRLAPGWLAVADIGRDGAITAHANRCGHAAPWCVVAPGVDVRTIDGATTGGYQTVYGTSYAAPAASAGLAGLKSLFPNLSYQALRTRVLHTARRDGRYANEAVYGQGLVDFDAASSPVGGTWIVEGAHAWGPAHGTASSWAEVGPRAAHALGGASLLVFDGFQRAPFEVPATTLVRTRRALLDWDEVLGSEDAPQSTRQGTEVRAGRFALGPARGAQPRMGAGALGLAQRQGALRLYAAVEGAGAPGAGAGLAGWAPRHAAGVEIGGARTGWTGVTFAGGLARPGGAAMRGALALDAHAMTLAHRRAFEREGRSVQIETWVSRLDARARTTLVSSQAGWVAGVRGATTLRTSARTTLGASGALESGLGPRASTLHAATGVDTAGQITRRALTLDDGAMQRIARVQAHIAHRAHPQVTVRAGAGAAAAGDGAREWRAGLRVEVRL